MPPPAYAPTKDKAVAQADVAKQTATPPAITYGYEINTSPLGHHWTLVGRQGDKRWTLAGHDGPNPKTHAGAVAAIEAFKKMVADAPIR